MYPLPVGWSEDQFSQLHAGFIADLVPALVAANAAGLRVRFRSGYRSNAQQRFLHESFEARLAAYERGELKAKPLPAAPPGSSAHNFALCSADSSHAIGGAEECPECSAAVDPAAVACDVQILGPNGQPIPSGGELPLEQRSHEWQQWAAILDRYPALRDGGDFAGRKDPVHVEWARWNHKMRALAPLLERAVDHPVAPPADVAAPADVTAVARPRRRTGRHGGESV
jgi:hypothetical protein